MPARAKRRSAVSRISPPALPQLQQSRARGASEPQARLDALMAIMTSLSDTCVLSRAGMTGLQTMQQGARAVLAAGGCASVAGRAAPARLDAQMLAHNASPGGAADLLPPPCFSTGLPANAFRGCYGTDYIVISCQPRLRGRALAGVVGSGDMEVLYTAAGSDTLSVQITTSVDNSRALAGAVRPAEPDQRPARRAVDYSRLRRHAGRRPYSY